MLTLILLCITLSASLLNAQVACTTNVDCVIRRQFCINNFCSTLSCANSSTSCPFAPYGNRACFFSQCTNQSCVILTCGGFDVPGSVCSSIELNSTNFACTLPCVNNVDCGNDQLYCVNQRCVNVGCTVDGSGGSCPSNFRPQDCRISQCSVTGMCHIRNCSFDGRVCDTNVGCVLPTPVPTILVTVSPTPLPTQTPTAITTPAPTTHSPTPVPTQTPTSITTTRSPTIDTPREEGIIAFIFAFLIAILLIVLICYFRARL